MRILGQHVHLPIFLLAIVEFGFAGMAFLFSAILLTSEGVTLGLPEDGLLIPWALGFSVAVLVGVTAMGLYQAKQRLRIEGVLARLIVALTIAAICLALLNFLFPAAGIEGPLWASSFGMSLLLLSGGRMMFSRYVDHEAFRRSVLVYGAGNRAANLLKLRRRSDQRGFRIVGFVPAPGERRMVDEGRIVNLECDILAHARANNISEVVIAMDDRRLGFPVRDLLDCKFAGVAVTDLLSFLEREAGKLKVDLVNPSWLIFSDGFTSNPERQFVARAIDIAASFVLLTVALPIMMVIALAILLEDGPPILYRQRRIGLNGKVFLLNKFRSMTKNAESDGHAVWAQKDDSRVTRVGAVIRKLRLDELPQLFNVIRGEMSLVGPRPERPEFVERLSVAIPYYHERHSVKPGITGWAQLCYPYGSSDEDAMEKLHYDLYYIKHQSMIFDLAILLQTVEVVVWSKGAR